MVGSRDDWGTRQGGQHVGTIRVGFFELLITRPLEPCMHRAGGVDRSDATSQAETRGREEKEQHEEVESRYKLSLVREDHSKMGTIEKHNPS